MGLSQARILERVERLHSIPLFEFMNDSELYQVARLVSEEWFEDGAYISREGERGRELYLVLQGEVKAIKEGRGEWTGHVARAGEVIGEVAALADLPRMASLRAKGDTQLLMMRGSDFRALLRDHPDLADQVIRILSARLAAGDLNDSR
jgi:CRP-like cAMP-binding protein